MNARLAPQRRGLRRLITVTAALVVLVAMAGVVVIAANGPIWPPRKWTAPMLFGFSGQAPFQFKPLVRARKEVSRRFEHGGLTLGPAAETKGVVYNGVTSTFPFDFTGQARSLKVDQSRYTFLEGTEAKFRITRSHETDYVSLERSEMGDLFFVQKAGGKLHEEHGPYDPMADAWFRIRHEPSDDTIRWETSRDGKTWIERAKDRRGFDLSKVRIELYAGTYKPTPSPGFVRFTDCCGAGK